MKNKKIRSQSPNGQQVYLTFKRFVIDGWGLFSDWHHEDRFDVVLLTGTVPQQCK